MDLSKHKIEVDEMAGEVLEPGVYNMSYVSAEEVEGKDGWLGCKMTFVSATFTLKHKEEKYIDWGKQSLAMLANAAGLTELKETDDLKGKVVSCEVRHNKAGYPEIYDNFGRNWKAVEDKPVAKKKVSKPDDSDDDIPF